MGVGACVRQALSSSELVAVVEVRNLTGDPVVAGRALVQAANAMQIPNVVDNRIDLLEAVTSQLRIHKTKEDFPPISPGGPGEDLGPGVLSAPHPMFFPPLNTSVVVLNVTFTNPTSLAFVRPRDTLQVPAYITGPRTWCLCETRHLLAAHLSTLQRAALPQVQLHT